MENPSAFAKSQKKPVRLRTLVRALERDPIRRHGAQVGEPRVVHAAHARHLRGRRRHRRARRGDRNVLVGCARPAKYLKTPPRFFSPFPAPPPSRRHPSLTPPPLRPLPPLPSPDPLVTSRGSVLPGVDNAGLWRVCYENPAVPGLLREDGASLTLEDVAALSEPDVVVGEVVIQRVTDAPAPRRPPRARRAARRRRRTPPRPRRTAPTASSTPPRWRRISARTSRRTSRGPRAPPRDAPPTSPCTKTSGAATRTRASTPSAA